MDVHLSIDHSLGILTPKTEAGTEWMDEHLPEDRPKVGNATVVELRYLVNRRESEVKRRKYRFATRAEAEDAERKATEELHLCHIALGEVPEYAAGRTADGMHYSLNAYRLDSASGGFVIAANRQAFDLSGVRFVQTVALLDDFEREVRDKYHSEYCRLYAEMCQEIRTRHRKLKGGK